ncbi:hypothetical protein NEMIN01_0556 [Nematocida minor]|uniref:uncharacterized protein n=1 Tax=Nematocida minor TaxID=1912983 RepID=UPI0022208584|nr:uncharacterized protein NEMIN01_0556 [Nematocida minor]KAI5189493.1 hypothetical protein NEMIN01_0556 [Nematocida minor]
MDSAVSQNAAENMNATTKKMLIEKKKSAIMNCLLSIQESAWGDNVFLESVREWLCLAESLDANSDENRSECEVLCVWKYLVEMLKSITLYSPEELAKAGKNIKEIIKAMNSIPTHAAGVFYLSSIIQVNKESPFRGEFNHLISEHMKLYRTLLVA